MNFLKQNWFKFLAILFLLGALGDNPYSYYQFLRWLILGIGAYSAYLSYNNREKTWAWIFGITAVLFNPIVPFALQRELWQVIDIIVAIIFLISVVIQIGRIRKNKSK